MTIDEVDSFEGAAGFFQRLESVGMATGLEDQVQQTRVPSFGAIHAATRVPLSSRRPRVEQVNGRPWCVAQADPVCGGWRQAGPIGAADQVYWFEPSPRPPTRRSSAPSPGCSAGKTLGLQSLNRLMSGEGLILGPTCSAEVEAMTMTATDTRGGPPSSEPLRRIGSRWQSGDHLTVHDQLELRRVAWASAPVDEVCSAILRAQKASQRIGCLLGGAGVLALAAVLLSLIPQAVVASYILLALFVGLTVAAMSVLHRDERSSNGVVRSLMVAIRELEQAEVHFGHSCYLIDRAAGLFYTRFRTRDPDKPNWWKTKQPPPRRYRAFQRTDAESGAVAIASQAYRLDGPDPRPLEAADDLRRALLRVVGGHWRQVAELNISGDRQPLWRPPGKFKRLGVWLSQDTTAKVFGLVTACVVLTATVIRLFSGS